MDIVTTIKEQDTIIDKSPTTRRICLSSFASPFFFGPYGAQLYYLITKLIQEPKYELYYMLLVDGLDDRIYSSNEIVQKNLENENREKIPKYVNMDLVSNLKFIGGVHKMEPMGTILASNINKLLKKHKIDQYIFLSDLNNIIPDEVLTPKSMCWYPNHFNPVVSYTINVLAIFSDIVSLCPSDQKLLKESIVGKKVHYIPHILDICGEKLEWKSRKEEFREKHQIPKNKFVVLINCGNYEMINRKGLDSALMAFEEFQRNRDDVYLFIHAWSLQNLQNTHYKSSNSLTKISDLLSMIPIPSHKITVHQDIVDYDTILEYIAMSDVLLQASRTEGFCMPIIESQLLKTPVVSNGFGAMLDYTKYGISTPIAQREYLAVAKGMWSIPSIKHLAEALGTVYEGETNIGDPEAVQKEFMQLTNIDTVYNQFLSIMNESTDDTSSSSNVDVMNEYKQTICTRVHYNASTNQFDLYKNFDIQLYKSVDKLRPTDLEGNWTCFFHENVPVDPMFFLFQNTTHNLIVLKTLYFGDIVYPTAEVLMRGEFDMSCINYAVHTSYIKYLFTSEMENVFNSYLIYYFLTHIIRNSTIALSDQIICKMDKNTNV